MLSKKSLIPGLALVLFLACSLTAGAQPPSQAASPAPGAAAFEKFESLKDQLWAKGAELKALQQAGNVQETRAVAAEMNKLKAQIRDERRKLAESGADWGGGHRGWKKGGPGGPKGRGGPGWGGHPCRE
jgi:hypothetical protein